MKKTSADKKAFRTVYLAELKTPAGKLLIAASGQGVFFSSFTDSFKVSSFKKLPRDHPEKPDKEEKKVRSWLQKTEDYLNNKSDKLNIQLDLIGSEFQKQVWRYLKRIPKGQVKSYSEIARALGRPKAYRAVANACAANKIALIVPCHRVVNSDQSPGGYRWGAARKKKILSWESNRKLHPNHGS